MLGSFFNICATTKDSDFKIGKLMGFAKTHHKIAHKRKRGRGPVLRELSKFFKNIYAMAESTDFKFGTQFAWPIQPIIKSHE